MSQATATATVKDSKPPAKEFSGRYQLLEQLGAGGMGSVHRARDIATGRIVAFKQLSSSLAGPKRKTLEALFEREYHTLVRLKHPRIIDVFDYGFTSDGPYYTMELLDGQDLQQLSPLPYKEACRHLRDVASSLALIHAHRLVHRDISPRNVRLTPDGRAKLIDFGALTAFGPAGDVVGTPVCMAPEVLRRMPLDQRTDLFALGAIAYFALTGQHAYPARRFDELAGVWQRAPIPPSQLAAGIPQGLESLVLSLLSLDPMERPSSAAAVIDQLTAVAELPAEDQDWAAESYLSSGRMVGRKGEEEWIMKRVARALKGKGGEVVIEGPAGVGKTRLLQEVGLIAQLKGASLLKADAEATPGFLGVAAALAVNLLAACPEPARRLVEAHASLLAQLSPELKEKLEQRELLALKFDANERRARLQTALFDWFIGVAAERPLLISVDNIQAADDGSAAFLAALGTRARETQLMILVSQRSGDAVVAANAVQVLRKRCSRLKLAGLSPGACEELVGSLFGDVANTGRMARILYEKSGGNPQLCTDLAQLLVKKKIARYAAGTWVLPLEVSADELPNRVDELLEQKLEALSLRARDLAEALSVHHKPVPIEVCLAVTADRDEQTALAALDELVSEQVLWIQGDNYRFAQDALREALLAQMDEPRRNAAHRRAAEVLLAADDSSGNKMEAGWHLLRGGEEGRGADLLAASCRQFLKTQGANESVEHVVRALRTAVEVYERLGRSDYQIAGLLFPLVPLSYFSTDWRVVQRYGVRAFQLGMQITGLSLAQRLSFVLGKKLALKIGLFVARWRFQREQQRGLELELSEAITSLCAMVPATMSSFATCLDAPATLQLLHLIAPLQLLPSPFAGLMYGWGETAAIGAQGLAHDARAGFARLVERFQEPKTREVLGDGHFRSMYGGALFAYAILTTYTDLSRTLELTRELEALGVRTWTMAADQIRMLAYAYRGEIERVRHFRTQVELFAVQGTAMWQLELFVPAVLLNADVQSGDTIAARRTWEQLARRARDVPSLEVYADAAHAAYLTLRGALPAAIEAYEKALPQFPPRHRVMWLAVRAYFAQALNQAGQHKRAKQLLTEALSLVDPNDDTLVLTLEARRQLALAEAGLGNREAASLMLEALLAKHGEHDNPMLVGLLHKARAEVALAAGDKAAFERHVPQMEQRFLATQNPALVAQCKRLTEAAARAGLRAPEPRVSRADAPPWMQHHSRSGHRSVAELTAAPDRAEYALWLVLEQARAKSGYLYLFENNAWRLGAASSPAEPPPGLETQLRERCEHSLLESQLEDESGTVVEIPTSGRLAGLSSARPASLPARAHNSARGDEDAIATAFEPVLSVKPRLSHPSLPAEQADKTVFIDSVPVAANDEVVYRMVVLSTPRDGHRVVVGGVILELGPHDLFRLNPELLDSVAGALYERCVTSVADPRS